MAGAFALAAIPARYALEREAWAEAARLELRPSRFPQADAITWFARGLGAARTGDLQTARAAIDALQQLEAQLAKAGESYWAEQVAIQRLGVVRVDGAQGRPDRGGADDDAAVRRTARTGPRRTRSRQDRSPRRASCLATCCWQTKRPADALAAFETTLKKEPNRYRALAGAADAARLDGRHGGQTKILRSSC